MNAEKHTAAEAVAGDAELNAQTVELAFIVVGIRARKGKRRKEGWRTVPNRDGWFK